MKTLSFTVDAALLRELGERLIGQPHIALAELVKNSYDADAATCRIVFSEDRIEILDDGKGMSFEEFRDFWMRIGTTHKVDQRQSQRLGRPLTGSKGVGRLAVQFLADEMPIETTSESNTTKMLVAIVDWRKAIRGSSLAEIQVEYEIRPNQPAYPNGHPHGTRIVLTQLKNAGGTSELEELGREIWRLRSPFRRRTKSPATRGPEDFEVEIEAPGIADARNAFDKVVTSLFDNWRARIRGTVEGGRSGRQANIVLDFAGDSDGLEKETFRERVKLPVVRSDEATETTQQDVGPSLVDRVSFEILIKELRKYLQEYGNVSIYDVGFRLPYYGVEHDWLDIALDQSRRISISKLLPPHLRIDERYMLDLPAPGRIFGAVNIDTGHELSVARSRDAGPGEWLQIQPGRDRLHDNPAFEQLRNLVRFSLDFYANRYRAREARSAEEKRSTEPATVKQERALKVLDRHREAIPTTVFREVKHEVAEALKATKSEERVLDRRAALLAPLATAGMVGLALNHELAREARFLDKAATDLKRLARKHSIPELSAIAKDFDEARSRLASLQELFAPLLSDEDKRASDRLEEWSHASGDLQRRAGICLLNQIAENDHHVNVTINTDFTEQNAGVHRFIPMPHKGMSGIERCFFLPIRKRRDDGSSAVSFDLFLLVAGQNCIAFRFEPADPLNHAHSYTHAQLCTKLVRKTLIPNVLPVWMPSSYPAFPVSASGPVQLFLAMATSVHGNHSNGLKRLLQDIFENAPNDAKHYAADLQGMLCI